MSLRLLKCKDNNAAIVKRIMPEPSGVTMHEQADMCLVDPIILTTDRRKALTLRR